MRAGTEKRGRCTKTSWQSGAALLGPEHPDTLLGMNNLGNLYSELGRFSDAEPLFRGGSGRAQAGARR